MDMKLNDAAKAAWCTALAEPELLQVTGRLYGEHKASQYGYCCLGVFARSQGASFVFETVTNTDEEGNDFEATADEATVNLPGADLDLNENELLEQVWADQFGLSVSHQAFLSHLNDGGEVTALRSDPFFALYVKYAEDESAPRLGSAIETAAKRLFKFRKHTFAEIRAIILVEF